MVFNKRRTAVQSAETETRVNAEAIAQRAYQKFLKRGRQHGNDLQDWLEAEQELNRESSRGRN